MAKHKIDEQLKQETVFIFDWDDTILPTSWLERVHSVAGARAKMQRSMAGLCAVVQETLSLAMQLGKVIVITNSAPGWVYQSCETFMPGIADKVDMFDVIAKPTNSPATFKISAFQRECKHFRNVVSVGDGASERAATLRLQHGMAPKANGVKPEGATGSARAPKSVKSVKLIEYPSCQHLIAEHEMLQVRLPDVASFRGCLDLKARFPAQGEKAAGARAVKGESCKLVHFTSQTRSSAVATLKASSSSGALPALGRAGAPPGQVEEPGGQQRSDSKKGDAIRPATSVVNSFVEAEPGPSAGLVSVANGGGNRKASPTISSRSPANECVASSPAPVSDSWDRGAAGPKTASGDRSDKGCRGEQQPGGMYWARTTAYWLSLCDFHGEAPGSGATASDKSSRASSRASAVGPESSGTEAQFTSEGGTSSLPAEGHQLPVERVRTDKQDTETGCLAPRSPSVEAEPVPNGKRHSRDGDQQRAGKHDSDETCWIPVERQLTAKRDLQTGLTPERPPTATRSVPQNLLMERPPTGKLERPPTSVPPNLPMERPPTGKLERPPTGKPSGREIERPPTGKRDHLSYLPSSISLERSLERPPTGKREQLDGLSFVPSCPSLERSFERPLSTTGKRRGLELPSTPPRELPSTATLRAVSLTPPLERPPTGLKPLSFASMGPSFPTGLQVERPPTGTRESHLSLAASCPALEPLERPGRLSLTSLERSLTPSTASMDSAPNPCTRMQNLTGPGQGMLAPLAPSVTDDTHLTEALPPSDPGADDRKRFADQGDGCVVKLHNTRRLQSATSKPRPPDMLAPSAPNGLPVAPPISAGAPARPEA